MTHFLSFSTQPYLPLPTQSSIHSSSRAIGIVLRAFIISWAGSLGLACTATIGAPEPDEYSIEDYQESEPLAGIAPGDEIEIDGLVMVAPEAGRSVTQHIAFADGTAKSISVSTRDDGKVVRSFPVASELLEDLGVVAPEPEGSLQIARGNPACFHKSFKLTGKKWKERLYWYASSTGRPGYLNRTKMESDFLKSMSVIVRSRNSCFLTDKVSAKSTYRGLTKRRPNISYRGRCTSTDGRSVMGFKKLASKSVLAVACVSAWSGKSKYLSIDEADVAFNSNFKWFHGGKAPTKCKSYKQPQFGIRHVATHEFGHVFGLAHVKTSLLTMDERVDGPAEANTYSDAEMFSACGISTEPGGAPKRVGWRKAPPGPALWRVSRFGEQALSVSERFAKP